MKRFGRNPWKTRKNKRKTKTMGQYGRAGDAGRYTLSDLTPSEAVTSKKAGHNRAIWTDASGNRHFRLIATDVVTAHSDGRTFTINSGGYASNTTLSAVLDAFAVFGVTKRDRAKLPGWRVANVWRAKGKAYPEGAELALMAGRYVPGIPGAPETHSDGTRFERRVYPFDERITFTLKANGAIDGNSVVSDLVKGKRAPFIDNA